MLVVLVVLVVLAGGCGRIAFDPLVDRGDGDGGMTDTRADACAFSTWSTPTQVSELSSGAAEFGGQITGNGLAYYFRSDRVGASDFYVAHRSDRASAFGTPALIPELSSPSDELDISVADDELDAYFSSNRMSGYCLYHASRPNTSVPFGNVTRLDALCPTIPAAGAYITDDELTLYYVRMDGSNYEGTLMISTRASTADAFDIGAPIAELLGGGFDKGYPVLFSDDLTLYFDGGTTHHLYEAVRPTINDPFGTPRMMTELNSASTDEDVSVTADGLELYFGSARLGGADDIFVTTRTCQ